MTVITFCFYLTDKQIVHVDIDSKSAALNLQGAKNFLREVFLPQGYPSSVSDDYLEYQIWDTIQVFLLHDYFCSILSHLPTVFCCLLQAFASSLSGSLATRAVLEGVGVGRSESTPLAATLMWLIKDGTGMVGRILFAWCKGRKVRAP